MDIQAIPATCVDKADTCVANRHWPLLAQSGQPRKRAGRGLQIGQPALGGKADKLGIRSHAGLGLYEIVIILDGLHAEIEI
jgi:hypothetical protein